MVPPPEPRPSHNGRARLSILVDFTPKGPRTLDVFFARLAKTLVARGWEVELTFAGLGPEEYGADLRRSGVQVGALRFPFGTASAFEFARRLRRRGNAVLQAHVLGSFEPRLLALRALVIARRLQVVDHLSGQLKQLGAPLERVRLLRGKTAGHLVDQYVAVSRFTAARLVRAGVPAHRVHLIENGIALERFAPGEPRTAKRRPTIAFAGQLIPEKGVQVLLEAAQRMPDAADWVIAGEGPLRSELEERAAKLGVPASFVGHVDIPELFQRADIVVVPSLWDEAFGLVAVEAMASQTAVVVSDGGGLPEVVGDTGLVVPRGDVGALHSVLRRLVDAPAERFALGVAAARRAAAHYSIERMIAEHVAAAERLLVEASA